MHLKNGTLKTCAYFQRTIFPGLTSFLKFPDSPIISLILCKFKVIRHLSLDRRFWLHFPSFSRTSNNMFTNPAISPHFKIRLFFRCNWIFPRKISSCPAETTIGKYINIPDKYYIARVMHNAGLARHPKYREIYDNNPVVFRSPSVRLA